MIAYAASFLSVIIGMSSSFLQSSASAGVLWPLWPRYAVNGSAKNNSYSFAALLVGDWMVSRNYSSCDISVQLTIKKPSLLGIISGAYTAHPDWASNPGRTILGRTHWPLCCRTRLQWLVEIHHIMSHLSSWHNAECTASKILRPGFISHFGRGVYALLMTLNKGETIGGRSLGPSIVS